MPVIQFGGYTTDPFGGPAGGTQQALAGLLDSYMKTQESQKKREQEQLLADLLGSNPNYAQTPGAEGPLDAEGVMMDPVNAQMRMQAVMSNPKLSIQEKLTAGKLLEMQQELIPKAAKQDYKIIEWVDKEGKPHSNSAPAAQYNEVVAQIEARGGTVGKPEKASYDSIWGFKPNVGWEPLEFEKGTQSASTAEWRKDGYTQFRKGPPEDKGDGKTAAERAQELRDKGMVQIGDGWKSESDLRQAWKSEYSIIDRDDINYYSLTPEQKAENDSRIARAPYSQFKADARRKGHLPGEGPLEKEPTVPWPDETGKGGPAPSVRKPKDEPPTKPVAIPEAEVEGLMKEAGWKPGDAVTPALTAKVNALYEKKKVRGK